MRLSSLAWAILCGAVLVGGCKKEGDGGGAGAVKGGQKLRLALNWKPEPEFGGFYAAHLSGAYASRGLAVEIVPGGSGTPTVQMVGAGRVDFGIASADEVVIARQNGNDVVALFAVYQTNPQGLMTHAERGLGSIADIFKQPGTLAIQRGLPYADFLEKKYGFDKVTVVPNTAGMPAFLRDSKMTMQCFVTSEPLVAEKSGAKVKTFLVADAGYNPYTAVLVTRGDYLLSQGEIVKKVLAAVREGWEDYLKDPKAANDAMGKLNPTVDSQTAAAMAAAQKELIETATARKSQLGTMTLVRWRTLVEQLNELKVVGGAPDPNACFVNP